MVSKVTVSVLCPDRIGLVAAVTGHLFDLGADLDETTFSVLGGNAEFATVCELPDEVSPEIVKTQLSALSELEGAALTVTRIEANSGAPQGERATHRIILSGGDRPGLIARLCEVFIQFNANIVHLNAGKHRRSGAEIFRVRMEISVSDENADGCLAHVANTAGELGLDCSWSAIGT